MDYYESKENSIIYMAEEDTLIKAMEAYAEQKLSALQSPSFIGLGIDNLIGVLRDDSLRPVFLGNNPELVEQLKAALQSSPAKEVEKPDFDRGCKCQQCGAIYKIDVIVDDAVWEKIKPKGKAEGAGLLCGSCILNRLEALNIGYSVVFIPERNKCQKEADIVEAKPEN